MTMTALTVLLAASLGGAIAVDVTVLIVAAAVALAALAAVNGLRSLADLTGFLLPPAGSEAGNTEAPGDGSRGFR